VLAAGLIRDDPQAHLALARVGEQPPSSTPTSLPVRTRRECAPTPNAGFCSLGAMRKLAAPKTSLRSAAVMATLRTADLSCAVSGEDAGQDLGVSSQRARVALAALSGTLDVPDEMLVAE